ncbi:MAG: AMP-binding protein [Anaerolineae bacterium]|nr:AMP-binding protein [Anaerolineae bacterium]
MSNVKYQIPQTLIQPIIERARSNPEHNTLVLLNEDGTVEHVNAADFHADAAAYAQALQAMGIEPQDLVILVLQHSRVLLSAFWGALYLGAIPSIFPFLTEKLDPALYMERAHMLVKHSGARVVITYLEFKDDLGKLLEDVDCRLLSTDEVPPVSAEDTVSVSTDRITGESIAFLQHSSGTTGLQKGVALSHRSVLNQVEAYSRAIDLRPNDVIVSWLPLYHDMGLIAGFVMPLVAGIPLVLMSPFQWVRDPKILFQAIHDYKGTLCWLPNFAYNHSARAVRPEYMDGIDLSGWRMVISCSEPVRHDSQQVFLEHFAPYGLREEALASCYAMAENTFAVTQSDLGQMPRTDWINIEAFRTRHVAEPVDANTAGAMPVVSCGRPIDGTEIAIIAPDGSRLPDRHEGEVILRGNSMLSGYYRRPDITGEAMLDGWYKTGDMGYIADGELYISGRLKDLIITGGKNVYPQDLEAIANTIDGIHPGRAVAFGVLDERLGSEAIVMVCETENAADPKEKMALVRALRQRVTQQTEVTISDIKMVDERWLIKTSSGKIARADNREKYLREFRGE